MAQTKKRRTTKHRGNAAGMVEARGRTGRKPRPEERSRKPATAAERRAQRMAKPPTWKGAVIKAALASAILFVLSLTLLDQSVASAAAILPLLFVIYVPLGFYTDQWFYRRQQRKQAAAR